jgi:SAM-dependent methyltransferase
MTAHEHIAVLSTELLESDRDRAEEFRALSAHLRIPLGWHYLLDLIWASRQLEDETRAGSVILDAGAGLGLIQWWLARRGVHVLSIDRLVRDVPRRLRTSTRVEGLNEGDLPPLRPGVSRLLRVVRSGTPLARVRSAASVARDAVLGEPDGQGPGRITFHRSALDDLSALASESVDAVVSISALEHNAPDRLPAIVDELMRIVRPSGKLVATLGSAKVEDWFHEPSHGWCYTEATLRRSFDLPDDVESNYGEWDELVARLRSSDELRAGLADFYFRSEENGMPGGRWDPQYQSVGVVKMKPA